ncbi:MAG: DNA polymerase III subunit alpha [Marinilabiliales bacterium]|nr:MAG: DNA polymerase III subunit alpha [Marinilabiliales bacterium]
MSKFTHLHLHTVYSVLDGASKINNLMDRAIELGMDSMAITDHGNMYGVLDFFNAAKRNGIKPIIGVETYVSRTSMNEQKSREDRSGHHLILLAKNLKGYQNLLKMVSEANLKGFYYTPRIDKELLSNHADGLIASSACLGGEVAQLLMHGKEDKAIEVIEWYKNLFGDDYYLEVMDHGRPEQKEVNEKLIDLSQKTGVKLVATNDVHFVRKEDFEAHKILIQINTRTEGKDDLHYTGNEFLKSYDEMMALFPDAPEAIANTQEIVDKVEDFSILHEVVLPVFDIPAEFEDDNAYLRHLTLEGAKRRYEEITDEISERIDFELSVIQNMGYPGYFLITQDFIAKAREMEVLVGPGRGSAAGSIVAFCLGITNIDPIKYKLLFERFLNPDRISLPDIDIDFDDDGRDQVIRYVMDKYGEEKVAQIVTMGKLAARSSVRDVARVFGEDLTFADKIAKLIPETPGITIEKALKESKELFDLRKSNNAAKKILDLAIVLEGNVRSTGVHACGVIIGPEALDHFVPLARQKEKDGTNLPVVQYEGSIVESAGMLKMDFLGLKTLTIIKDCLDLVEKRHEKKIDIDNIPVDDPKTFQLYQKGETIGTFQFESEGMRTWLKKLKPTDLNDLIAMNALYRPGPMDNIPNYIRRKHGKERIMYPHPMAEEILSDTFGIMIFQEQIMLLSQELAGFTKGEADSLRKAMGKKKHELIAQLRSKFVDGAQEKGIDKKTATDIYDAMAKFGQYGFNKSHSAAYSVLAYQTAYLKANYPAEYMSAVLGNNLSDLTKITIFINECKRMGVPVLGPDVNESEEKFAVNDKNEIRFGFAALKNVGESAAESIVAERQENGLFKDIHDFFNRISLRVVNKRALESLASTGAFHSLGTHRAQFFYREHEEDSIFLEKLIKHAAMVQERQNNMQASLFGDTEEVVITNIDLPECEAWRLDDMLKMELEIAGFYISGHPLDEFESTVKLLATHSIDEIENDLERIGIGQQILFAGVVKTKQERYDKKGNKFMIAKLFDYSGEKDLMLFRDDYERFADKIIEGAKLFFHAKVEPVKWGKNEGNPELKLQKIYSLNKLFDKVVNACVLHVQLDDISSSFADAAQDIIRLNAGAIPLTFSLKENGEETAMKMGSEFLKLNKDGIFKLQQLPEVQSYSLRNILLKGLTHYERKYEEIIEEPDSADEIGPELI